MDGLEIEWTRLRQVLDDFADSFIQNARFNLQGDGSNVSYALYDSFEKVIDIGEDYFRVNVSLEDYWKYVNEGRGPGKFPPPDRIREWIEVKPVDPYPLADGRIPTVEQMGFMIGRKIATEGTEGTHFFDEAKERTIKDFEERISLAIEEDVSNHILRIVEEGMRGAFS